MKKQSPVRRYAGIWITIALIVVFIVLRASGILDGEKTTALVRILAFLPVLLTGMGLFLEKEETNGKKALYLMLCLGAAASFALLTRLTPMKGLLSGVFGPDAVLLIPGMDGEGRAASALVIGIFFALGMLAATILSIGKQKKGRRMKRRPLDQLIQALLTAILVIVVAISLFLCRGIPIAALIALVLFVILKAIPSKKLSVQTAVAVALIASVLSGVMLGAAL